MQTIQLDISQIPAEQPVLRAKQADVGRKFMARITDNGVDWPVPEDAVVSVWYAGTAGEGNYTHIGQAAAAQISGNTITVELISQMLTTPGGGMLSLALNRADGSQLGLWSIHYWVEPVPGADSQEAIVYYNAFAQSAAEVMAAAEKLTFPVSVAHGGTGATDAAAAKANLGILSEEQINTLVNNGKSKFVKLWQNAALSSVFNAQDISVANAKQYDLFVFRFRYRTTESRVFSVVMMPIELYNSNVCLYIPGGQWDGGNTLHGVHR